MGLKPLSYIAALNDLKTSLVCELNEVEEKVVNSILDVAIALASGEVESTKIYTSSKDYVIFYKWCSEIHSPSIIYIDPASGEYRKNIFYDILSAHREKIKKAHVNDNLTICKDLIASFFLEGMNAFKMSQDKTKIVVPGLNFIDNFALLEVVDALEKLTGRSIEEAKNFRDYNSQIQPYEKVYLNLRDASQAFKTKTMMGEHLMNNSAFSSILKNAMYVYSTEECIKKGDAFVQEYNSLNPKAFEKDRSEAIEKIDSMCDLVNTFAQLEGKITDGALLEIKYNILDFAMILYIVSRSLGHTNEVFESNFFKDILVRNDKADFKLDDREAFIKKVPIVELFTKEELYSYCRIMELVNTQNEAANSRGF